MQLLALRHAPATALVAGVAVLVVGSAGVAHAAPAPVSGLTASLVPHGLQLTWTGGGTGTPVVRDVTGLAAPYDAGASGRLVTSTPTASCPAATCAVDTGFSNTTTQSYAVWPADADGTLGDPVTLDVAALPPAATTTTLDAPVATVLTGGTLSLVGHVTRAGLPYGGAVVQLRSSVLGSTSTSTLTSRTTAADGSVHVSLVPVRSRTYWLVLPADAWSAGSTSVTRTVRLQPRVTVSVSPTTVPWKQSAVLRGSAAPNLYGGTVLVQRWTSSGWANVSYRPLSSASTWALTVTMPVGTYRYRALLLARTAYLGATSGVATLTVVPRTLYAGLSGPDVLALERRLAQLHYDTGAVDGYFDSDLRHAVIAFQKVERLSRTGRWTATERARVLKPYGFRPRHSTSAMSVEVDITRQVLVLAKNGVVLKVVDVSTGSDQVYYQDGVRQVAHTPRGTFRIYRKIDGIRISALGALYRPSYFYKGWAVHGSSSVPVYPASHGCVRITNHVADRLFWRLVIGTRVYVYDE